MAQGLNAARKPSGVGRLKTDARLVHIQNIALIHKTGLIRNRGPRRLEVDRTPLIHFDRKRETGGGAEIFSQEFGHFAGSVTAP